jgi:hypothetical protein
MNFSTGRTDEEIVGFPQLARGRQHGCALAARGPSRIDAEEI